MSNISLTADNVPRSRSARESFWRDTLAAFVAGGESVSAFCNARGLKTPTFYAWRLKLDKCDRRDVSPTPARSAGPAFLPVTIKPCLARRDVGVEEPIQVELRGGRLLRLPASIPAARLAEVLHALEGQP